MWAIVPLKRLDDAKQRLSSLLDPTERRELMLAMARDVLTALSRSQRLGGILIVSRTAEADALAQVFATQRFAESPDADLTAALSQASVHLTEHFSAGGVMIIPADVPTVTPEEIDTALQHHQSITVIPDDKSVGTNGLIVSPPRALPLLFDGRSFHPHVAAARGLGFAPKTPTFPGFALDIDTPADLRALLALKPTCQTATYLEKSGIALRLAEPDND